jgi:hypothetical protein
MRGEIEYHKAAEASNGRFRTRLPRCSTARGRRGLVLSGPRGSRRESLTGKDREHVLHIKVVLPALTPRNPNSARDRTRTCTPQRTLEPKRTQEALQTPNLLGKDASADVPRGSEKTHSGQDVPEPCDVVTMSDVRACAKALVQRVAEGGEIPIASLRELGDLVLRSELVAVSQQLLDGPPEFTLRRAMELAGLILAVVASDGRDAEQRAAK